MEALGLRDDTGDKTALAAHNSLQLIAFSIGEQLQGIVGGQGRLVAHVVAQTQRFHFQAFLPPVVGDYE